MGLPDRLPNQTCLARVQSESQCLGTDLGQFYKKGHHTRLKRYYKGLRSLRGCAGAPGALGKAGTEEPESSQARSPPSCLSSGHLGLPLSLTHLFQKLLFLTPPHSDLSTGFSP